MRRSFAPFAALIASGLLLGAAAPIAAQPSAAPIPANVIGRWVNPKKTAVVDTAPCGTDGRLCGTVVCATPEAIAKARDKGTPNLVGTQLLERLQYRAKDKRWRGKVFVPDFPGRFEAVMTPMPGGDRAEVKGCALAGLLCKRQMWERVSVTNACSSYLRK